MKIGIDANEANVFQRVGSNQFAYQILQKIYQLDKTNQYFIYLKSNPVPDLPKPKPNWQYRVLKPGLLWTQWRLPLDLYFKCPRVAVFLTLGHYAPRISPMPNLISIMDLAFLHFPKTYTKKDLYQLKNWTKYSVRKAQHIFTISKTTKTDLINRYNLPANKISITYPGFVQNSSTQKFSLVSNYLLYLGTLQPRKNLKNLILAFNQLKHKYPDLKLVIAGKKGWLYQPLFDLVKKLNLNKRVIFPGFIKSNQLDSLVKQAKLFILPSFYEGFGIPVLKAMNLKTPVLVSQNSSLVEIVGDCGYYIKPPFDVDKIKVGIISALTDKQSHQQAILGKALKQAKQFSWEKSAKTIIKVLNSFAD